MRSQNLHWSLVLALAIASPAAAADEQRLGRDRPTATFEGKKGVGWSYGAAPALVLGSGCHGSGIDCETTLVRLTDPGRFTAFADSGEDLLAYATLQVLSTEVYEADAYGRAGRLVSEGSGATAVVADADAGRYVVLVRWVQGAWDYTGRLGLEPRPDAE